MPTPLGALRRTDAQGLARAARVIAGGLGRLPRGDCGNCCGVTGACCIGSACSQRTQAECFAVGGLYFGDGVPCNPSPCPNSCCDDYPGICYTGSGDTFVSIQVSISGYEEYCYTNYRPDVPTASCQYKEIRTLNFPPQALSVQQTLGKNTCFPFSLVDRTVVTTGFQDYPGPTPCNNFAQSPTQRSISQRVRISWFSQGGFRVSFVPTAGQTTLKDVPCSGGQVSHTVDVGSGTCQLVPTFEGGTPIPMDRVYTTTVSITVSGAPVFRCPGGTARSQSGVIVLNDPDVSVAPSFDPTPCTSCGDGLLRSEL
jgi:hypothetical protein